jgi:hypothetical protein
MEQSLLVAAPRDGEVSLVAATGALGGAPLMLALAGSGAAILISLIALLVVLLR